MAKKIKITFDANPLVGSKTGIGQLTDELIQSIAKYHQEDIEFIGYYFNFLNMQKPSLPTSPNIRYKKCVLIHPKIISALRKVSINLPVEFLSRTHADINIFTNFVALPSLFKSKNVVFVYDMCFADFPEYVSDKNGKFLRRWVEPSVNKADFVVTISNFTKGRIISIYGTDTNKITVIPVPPKNSVNAGYSATDNELSDYILFVGTIEPRKNILNLLTAYEMLDSITQSKHPLVLAGAKGWKDEQTLQKINELRLKGLKIIQPGYISDEQKAALYEKAVLVVQVSHYEGFGMPILEAMSFEKPVLCSDIPVFREIAGDAAIYADKDSPSDIKNKLLELLNNDGLRESLSKKSKDFVGGYPSWEDVAKLLSDKLAL